MILHKAQERWGMIGTSAQGGSMELACQSVLFHVIADRQDRAAAGRCGIIGARDCGGRHDDEPISSGGGSNCRRLRRRQRALYGELQAAGEIAANGCAGAGGAAGFAPHCGLRPRGAAHCQWRQQNPDSQQSDGSESRGTGGSSERHSPPAVRYIMRARNISALSVSSCA